MVDVYLLAKLTDPLLCMWRYFSTPHGYIFIQVWSEHLINGNQKWCFLAARPQQIQKIISSGYYPSLPSMTDNLCINTCASL